MGWSDNGILDIANTTLDNNQLWTFFERVAIQPPLLATHLRIRVHDVVAGIFYRLGLYSDVGAAPSTLLAQTAAFAVADATLYEQPLIASVTLADNYVWVARQTNSNGALLNEPLTNLSTFRDTVSGGYPAGFPAVAVAVAAADPAWCGLYDGARVIGLPQGCYYIEYSIDNLLWTDISGKTNSIRTPRRARRFSETQPQATDVPVVTMGKRAAERVSIEVMYTQKDADVFNVLRQRFENNELLMLRWSPAGGNADDYNFITDAVYSYVVDMEVPGADTRSSADPLIATFSVITQDVTQGVV